MGEDQHETAQPRGRFGAFEGVFLPTVLTILGVILFLRTGWLVGQVGVVGAWVIITLAFVVTATTGLSLASIVSNMRLGAGGAFFILTRSLGIELGGGIGVSLYLSQALVATLYIFGFREGWLWIFPDHPALAVDLVTAGALVLLAWTSAKLAFKLQYLVAAVIVASLVSAFVGFGVGGSEGGIPWLVEGGQAPWRMVTDGRFWAAFAVFFPAATGIMAGANMSGELKSPARDVGVGTLAAIGISYVIYMALAFGVAYAAPLEALQNSDTVAIDQAQWRPLALAGLLGATFSSALATIVGAPRILQALADRGVVPASSFLAKLTDRGEPARALLVTATLIGAGVLLRDLNAIAPLITMFFLLTYFTLNLTLAVEQWMGRISFRPTFRIPTFVPVIGAIGCLAGMILVDPVFTVISGVVVVAFQVILVRRDVDGPYGELRSGVAFALADWVARQIDQQPNRRRLAWKPDTVVALRDPSELDRVQRLLESLARPDGTLFLMGLWSQDEEEPTQALQARAQALRRAGVLTRWSASDRFAAGDGLRLTLSALRGAALRPNLVVLPLGRSSGEGVFDDADASALVDVLERARAEHYGALLFQPGPDLTEGGSRYGSVHVFAQQTETQWTLSLEPGPMDLALLVGYRISHELEIPLHLHAVATDDDEVDDAEDYLDNVRAVARLDAETEVHVGTTEDAVKGDDDRLLLFELAGSPDPSRLRRLAEAAGADCVFACEPGEADASA